MESGWFFFSKGIVADDPIKGKNFLLIHPIEAISYDGVITPEKKKDKKGMSSTMSGIMDAVSTKKYPVLNCNWMGDGSGNRITPPTVKKGTTVDIYRNSNSTEFRWKIGQYEADLRKKEYAGYVWSNLRHGKEDHDKIPDNENSTYAVIDNEAGEVKFHTPNNDKEKASIDIHIDMKEGVLTASADRGHSISFNFNTGEFKSSSGVFVFNNPVIFNGPVTANGASNFNAAVTMNSNAKTSDGATVL